MPETDFERMQEEAARRAREMQARARFPNSMGRSRGDHRQELGSRQGESSRPADGSRLAGDPRPADGSRPAGQHFAPQEFPAPQPPQSPGQSQNSLLDTLMQDKERTVILALLVLLSGEEGNHELLFALMFLLM